MRLAVLADPDSHGIGGKEGVFRFTDSEAYHTAGLGHIPAWREFGLRRFLLSSLPLTISLPQSPCGLSLASRMILLLGVCEIRWKDGLSTPCADPGLIAHAEDRYHQSGKQARSVPRPH